MKKKVILVLTLFLGWLAAAVPASAWLYVADYDDSGWQTYYYSAGADGFSGFAGFVASNAGDTNVYSRLLLDWLSHGPEDNTGFESGDIGYTLWESSNWSAVNGPVTALSDIPYYPTEGDSMSQQWSFGADTSEFTNAYGMAGTIGSVLEMPLALEPDEAFFFDWAFLTEDEYPFADFSLFYLQDATGKIVFTEGLGQLGPVPTPEPSTFLLVGIGLALAGIARKKLK